MIVVDVGCHQQGREESVQRLIDRFAPQVLFGFDPHPELTEGVTLRYGRHASGIEYEEPTTVYRRRAAAWVDNGPVPYVMAEAHSGVEPRLRWAPTVEAFDLTAFLLALPQPIVLKLDCEGCEYPILRKLRRHHVDARLDLILVEWHRPNHAHGLHTRRPVLSCPVEEW